MTKAQINYAKERISVIARQHYEKAEGFFPIIPDLSLEEKVGMVISGEAELRIEDMLKEIQSGECSYWLQNALKVFRFPANDENLMKRAERERKIRKVLSKIKKAEQEYLDKIVISGKAETAMLKAFQNRKFK